VGHKRGWTREDLYECGFLKRLEAGRHTTEEEHPMLQVGDKAPDFTLPSDSGASVSLKDLLDKTLVLYFFPKADTPG